MAKYFKNIKSLEDLKAQFRALARKNHPDVGGDVEVMKIINCEYDALFPIWKNFSESETGKITAETADSTRRQFYTQCGWEGCNHDWNRSLKDVAQIVRTYVKGKYPTYKFSVRTHYASMCQELTVELKESPIEIYKIYKELTDNDKSELLRIFLRKELWSIDNWTESEQEAEFKRIWNNTGNRYKCLNEITKSVIDDVDAFVKSYNYSDCDGMIDYFDVDFYYFGCAQENGAGIKIVTKTAKLQTKKEPSSKVLPVKATVTENLELNGIEITFPAKPDDATLEMLKAAKFRWHRTKKLWYAKKNPETTAVAEKLSGVENENSSLKENSKCHNLNVTLTMKTASSDTSMTEEISEHENLPQVAEIENPAYTGNEKSSTHSKLDASAKVSVSDELVVVAFHSTPIPPVRKLLKENGFVNHNYKRTAKRTPKSEFFTRLSFANKYNSV